MTMTTNDETVSGPFGVPAEPRPSAREAIQGMLVLACWTTCRWIDDGDLQLTGEGGFIPEMIKAVLERGLNAELDLSSGVRQGDPAGRALPNLRNGTTRKRHSEVGSIPLDIPGTGTRPSNRDWCPRANDDRRAG